MGAGTWTGPSQHACVSLGFGMNVTAYTLRMPPLTPVPGVCVCTVLPSVIEEFLGCCSSLTAQPCGVPGSICC